MARAAETTADAIKRAIEECESALSSARSAVEDAEAALTDLRALVKGDDGGIAYDPEAPDPAKEKRLLADWNRISTEARGQKGATA